jgi:hypothetical protein
MQGALSEASAESYCSAFNAWPGRSSSGSIFAARPM